MAFVYLVAGSGQDPVKSFITALAAGATVIVVWGIAERRWTGDKHVADLNQALRYVERGFNERLLDVERGLGVGFGR